MAELDLVASDDQITHEDLSLDLEDLQIENNLNFFKFDPAYTKHEQDYEAIKKEILGSSSSSATKKRSRAPSSPRWPDCTHSEQRSS